MRDCRGLFSLVEHVTRTSDLDKVMDIGGRSLLLSGILKEAIHLGVPDVIDYVREKSKEDRALEYAARANTLYSAQMGDLTALISLLAIVGPARMKADMPHVVSTMLSNYRMPYKLNGGLTSKDYAAEYARMKGFLDQIDANWGYYMRNGVRVSDLGLFSNASSDAILILSEDPQWRTATMVARDYPMIELNTSMKLKYPMVAFNN